MVIPDTLKEIAIRVIMAGATAIAYIIGEGMVDAKSTNIKPQTNPEIIYDDDEYEDEEGDCDDE